MGYTTCLGGGPHQAPHSEERNCDGCDQCPLCQHFIPAQLWCWRCCGKLVSCPSCAPRLAAHILDGRPPEGEFAQCPQVMVGYRAALSITRPQTPKDQAE